jgi:hypothetical protein
LQILRQEAGGMVRNLWVGIVQHVLEPRQLSHIVERLFCVYLIASVVAGRSDQDKNLEIMVCEFFVVRFLLIKRPRRHGTQQDAVPRHERSRIQAAVRRTTTSTASCPIAPAALATPSVDPPETAPPTHSISAVRNQSQTRAVSRRTTHIPNIPACSWCRALCRPAGQALTVLTHRRPKRPTQTRDRTSATHSM